eukprot:2148258-Rhodomonas_salina.1
MNVHERGGGQFADAPGTEQVVINNSTNPNPTTNPTPPISQDAMAAPMGIPSLGQNVMAAPNLGPQNLSQNAMAALNVIPVMQQAISPFSQNAMPIQTIGSLPA